MNDDLIAGNDSLGNFYLLTNTAERFFERLGYRRTDRENAPEAIRRTQEFSGLCPSSSALMVKALPANFSSSGREEA